jgi:NDP-sugar pyrophosphorylase family protein
MNVRAAIVAGGLATRMQSMTALPKAMLPIAGKPLLFRHLDALAEAGIADVTICAGRRADDLASSIAYRSDLRVHIAQEPTLLGSGGCIGAACAAGDGDLVVIFGDVMSDVAFAPLVSAHASHSADATLVVHANDHPWDSDVVETDAGGRIVAIHRKPHPPGAVRSDLA